MEPKSGNTFEQPSVPVEYNPGLPEVGQVNHERSGEVPRLEREPSANNAPLPATPPVALPLPTPVQVQGQQAQIATDDNPATAGDDDLIEKEWVDKAKKIINDTRNDPYNRERAINKLQADYLKKRYGKTLGNSE